MVGVSKKMRKTVIIKRVLSIIRHYRQGNYGYEATGIFAESIF